MPETVIEQKNYFDPASLGNYGLPWADVSVPEWGNQLVRVRGMSMDERELYEAQTMGDVTVADGKVQMKAATKRPSKAKIVGECCIVSDGSMAPLFSKEQLAQLGKQPGAAIARLFKEVLRLSGLGEKDPGKGSESNRDGDSNSG